METRAIDVATALLVATAALCCSVVVGCAFLLLVAAADAKVLPRGGELGAWLAAAALACASVAALIALTRDAGGLRPGALFVAWVLAFAWPLSGFPLPAALIATLGSGLAVAWGARGASGRPGAHTAALLAAVAIELVILAFVAAPDEGAAYRAQHESRATARAAAPSGAADRLSAGADRAPSAGADRAPSGAADRSSAGAEMAPSPTDEGSSAGAEMAPSPTDGRAASPARLVRGYYRALDGRDFRSAWRALSPTVRTSFGGIERWRAGFAATLSSAPRGLRVSATGDAATVAHVLTARDRADCGVLTQQFTVQWRLHRTAGAWRAIALSAQPRGAPSCA